MQPGVRLARPAVGVLLVVLVGSFPGRVFAQDAHYWSSQFGPRSSLLGGAVIGSVDDISATFYNPGALSMAESLSFALSANFLDNTQISVESNEDERADLGTSRTGFRPSLVAGTLKQDLPGHGILAYSLLTRSNSEGELSALRIAGASELPPGGNLRDLAVQVQRTQELNDIWGGLSYSRSLGERLGVGVSWYGAVRSQDRRQERISQGIETDGQGRTTIEIRDGKFNAARTLLKFGVFGETGPFSGGVSLTTPSLHVAGKGEAVITNSTTSPDTNTLSATSQTKLEAEFKSPLSVGFGVAWLFGDTRVQASAEWYDAVAPYTVMSGPDYQSQEPVGTLSVDVVQAQDDVVNWALGVEHAFNPRITGYGSFTSERSTLTDDIERADLSMSNFDIRSFRLGADFMVGAVRLTLGGGYAWGSEFSQELTDLLKGNDPNYEASLVYRSVSFLFGLSIGGS